MAKLAPYENTVLVSAAAAAAAAAATTVVGSYSNDG
jgi:hypothetical protein